MVRAAGGKPAVEEVFEWEVAEEVCEESAEGGWCAVQPGIEEVVEAWGGLGEGGEGGREEVVGDGEEKLVGEGENCRHVGWSFGRSRENGCLVNWCWIVRLVEVLTREDGTLLVEESIRPDDCVNVLCLLWRVNSCGVSRSAS